jgi:putative heme transporter
MKAMVADPAGMASQRHRWWHRGPFVRREVRVSVGTLLVFLFVFYLALPLLASHRAEVNSLAHINMAYLALGVLLEIAALAAYTQLTHAVLPVGGPRRFRLFRINMSTLSLSHVSPGGTAPGAALGYRLLTQSGVTGSDAGFALGTQGIGSAVVLNVMFWFSLVAFLVTHGFHVPASHHGHQSQSASILVIVAAAVGVILLGAFGSLFYLLTRGQQQASRVIRRLAARIRFLDADRTTALVERLAERFAALTQDRALTRRAVGWAAANWLLDAASLWVFVAAFSHFISPIDLLMAYGLANILAAIPITPGGLGVVEFVLVSMITGFGPTAGEALSGVLAYRAVNFWLPIPFGGLAYASLEFERRPSYRKFQDFLRRRFRLRGAAATTKISATSAVTAVTAVSAVSAVSDEIPAGGSDFSDVGEASVAPDGSMASASARTDPASAAMTKVHSGMQLADSAGIREPAFGTDPAG